MSLAAARTAILSVAAGCLAGGCVSGREPLLYIMTPAAGLQAPLPPDAAVPHLLVGPVRVPEFLDSTDILVRRGAGELVPRDRARWGERLSVGVRDALLADLRDRLPDGTLVGPGQCVTPFHFLSVSVVAFDVRADGSTVLVASWVMRDGRAGVGLAADQGTFTVPAAMPGKTAADAVIVATMTRALDALAARLAVLALEPIPERSPPSSGRIPPC